MTRPILALLPGLLCDQAVWASQVQALSGHAQCVVPDYGSANTIEAMAQAVLRQVPAGPLSVAGHSMGGRVALELMRQVPDRIHRLALLDTGTRPLADGAAGEGERKQRMALLETARRSGMRAMGEVWARGMVHPDWLGTPLFEEVLDMIARKSPDVFEAQIEALLRRPDARPVLSAVRVHTLIAVGRQDAWSPLAQHEEMHQAVRGARLAIIEDASHMVTMEQPVAVSRLLHEWLDGASG